MSSSVDQSAASTSTWSSSRKISAAASASFGSSSAVTIRAFSPRTPERSHAVPTPQPVPNSAMVPSRVAASIASSRPVSLRQKET